MADEARHDFHCTVVIEEVRIKFGFYELNGKRRTGGTLRWNPWLGG